MGKTIEDFFEEEKKLKRKIIKLNKEYADINLMFFLGTRIRRNKIGR